MTKWKQRRLDREKLVKNIAIVSAPIFLNMMLEKSIQLNVTVEQAKELRQTAAECAWAHGELMAKVKL